MLVYAALNTNNNDYNFQAMWLGTKEKVQWMEEE